MANLRQSVVMRRDLGMTPGLASAQASHLNDMWERDRLSGSTKVERNNGRVSVTIDLSEHEYAWLPAPVLSVLAVDTPEELEVLIKRAKDVGVAYRVWKDTIPSNVFSSPGKPYYIDLIVGVAFGPSDDELIKQVTGGLPMY